MKDKSMPEPNSTIDEGEIERFSRIADEWWNEKGKFAPLHAMNPLRIEYIKNQVRNNFFSTHKDSEPPLKELRLLDIGCGGGLISEPMARLGASVTAIDASEKNIRVAKLHTEKMGLGINYIATSVESLAEKETGIFDVILALEIVEHVADVELFIKNSCTLLKQNGIIIVSTLNRTAKSYALAILGAEYIARMLPIGTHSWKKFLRPSELCAALEKNSVEITDMAGMVMNPLTWKWRMDNNDLTVNYIMCGRKE